MMNSDKNKMGVKYDLCYKNTQCFLLVLTMYSHLTELKHLP